MSQGASQGCFGCTCCICSLKKQPYCLLSKKENNLYNFIQLYTTSECLRAPAKVVLVVHVVFVVLKNNHCCFRLLRE